MRLLGIDYGSKTIGVAISDPMGITAQGLETIQRCNREEDLRRLKQVVDSYQVETIVVGLPRNMNGTIGESARRAESFARRLESVTGIPVLLRDERLTTVAAERAMLEGDLSRRKRKEVIDRQAAQLILQNYLDSLRFDRSPEGENNN